MNRINQLFQDSPKNLLSVYFCAGFPTLNSTADVITENLQPVIDWSNSVK